MRSTRQMVIAELIRCAGDLVAASLIKAQLVCKTDIFGLVLNYNTSLLISTHSFVFAGDKGSVVAEDIE